MARLTADILDKEIIQMLPLSTASPVNTIESASLPIVGLIYLLATFNVVRIQFGASILRSIGISFALAVVTLVLALLILGAIDRTDIKMKKISVEQALYWRVENYLEAHNNHDVDRIMDLCTEDIRLEFVGYFVLTGNEEVRKFEEFEAAIKSYLTFKDYEFIRNMFTFKVTEKNEILRKAGIGLLNYERYTIIFRDKLIKEIKAEISQENARTMEKVYQSFMK